jgi:hypothetical protein
MNTIIQHNGFTLTIWTCQERNWRGWYEYSVTYPGATQKITGRSRGTKREIIRDVKFNTDNSEVYKTLKLTAATS